MNRYLLFAVLLVLSCLDGYSQFNPDLDATKGRRKSATMRDDQLWHHETARTSYRKAGNVSVLTASRVGITERMELSTYLAADFFQPNVMLKCRWNSDPKLWFFSSRFNIGSAYPGLFYAQKHDKEKFVRREDKLPLAIEFGHELMISRRFSGDVNCTDGSDYLILTASLGTYMGAAFREGSVPQIPRHFLANRSEVLLDNDFLASLKIWADWRMLKWANMHCGVRLFNWSFDRNFAFEFQAEAEGFIVNEFSVKLGGALSIANYESVSRKVGAVPIVDLVYYFGKRKSKERDLFNPNGKLY
ncbi:MAG: hypothetical protein MJZ15_09315 [Bacteroidales bacterium]|nr:hypothetical protein [Bacteroidales bacterium]